MEFVMALLAFCAALWAMERHADACKKSEKIADLIKRNDNLTKSFSVAAENVESFKEIITELTADAEEKEKIMTKAYHDYEFAISQYQEKIAEYEDELNCRDAVISSLMKHNKELLSYVGSSNVVINK